ncbi:transposase [Neobacillus rhizophilus]|uniref:transposase n=1 Tax=Neobacillus rhizophilus TaxID=2833579 RepID=UPI003558FCA5
MPDHVHMVVNVPSKVSISSFIRYLKRKSAFSYVDPITSLVISAVVLQEQKTLVQLCSGHYFLLTKLNIWNFQNHS